MAKTFVLLHGAWHGGWCWERVAAPLRARGHRVTTPTQTGLGERRHLISREICRQRQSENFHKCPNCIRSRIWRERNGYPVDVEGPVEDGEMDETSAEAAVAGRRSA